MACVAAERGPEPPAFRRRPDASAPRLAHGYGLRSVNELRDLEFGRLAGEARARGDGDTRGRDPRVGLAFSFGGALCA